MMRPGTILLVNPHWQGIKRQLQPQFKRVWQPLDLALAAALLEENGFTVQILDNNVDRLSPEAIGRLAEGFEKIFITSTPYDRWQCPSLDIQFFFDTVRHIPRNRLYIMGAHVTERPEVILKKSGARAAILGEPEQTILDIAQKDKDNEICALIQGIAYLKGNRLVKTATREQPLDLNQLPYPAYHLLKMDQYRYEFMGGGFAILEGSRGCPHGCHFCYLGMYGPRFRQKPLERLLDEVRYITREFQVQNIYFMDLEFGLNRKHLIAFCKALLELDLGIRWCCQTRVTDVDGEVLNWMKKAGCTLIHFGVEAGSERILHQTGKGLTVKDCVRALELTREAGIKTALFMNFGFPGETLSEMNLTVELAIRLNPTYAAFHLIVPFPGTELARQTGLDMAAFPPHLYPHFNFIDHDLKTLKSVLRKAYLRFYLRPAYLMGLLRRQIRPDLDQGRLFMRLIK
ncbi:MAG: B12-binding domain-containing radical SAM protein [Deltaproteobacteria bacterium]|nr:B12-binding domain-containing radical SAM protein [Deltaproteobacteria bacterium]